jgi:hypothetical protein
MRRGLVVVLLVALVATGGCTNSKKSESSGGDASLSTGGEGATGADDKQGEDDDHAPPTLVDPATGKQGRIKEGDKYTAVSPPPVEFRPADVPGPPGEVPLTASVSPGCVEHGQTVTIQFKSEPGITVASQIKWPTDQFSGLDNTRGTTGPDGVLIWKVEVKPTALYGVADAQGAAIDERPEGRSRKGTFGNWEFVVAPPGRC